MEKICRECGELKKHMALGLCKNCYWKHEWKTNLRRRRRSKEINKIYYQKHKEEIAVKRKQQYRDYSKKIRNPRDRLAYNNHKAIIILKIKRKDGYWVYIPGKKPVHTAIAEKTLGRKFKNNEVVHHIDGNGFNNSHNNLMICTNSYHMWLHWQIRRNY